MKTFRISILVVLLSISTSSFVESKEFLAVEKEEQSNLIDFLKGIYDGSGLKELEVVEQCRFQAGSLVGEIYTTILNWKKAWEEGELQEFLVKKIVNILTRIYLSILDCTKDMEKSADLRRKLARYFKSPNIAPYLVYKLARNSAVTIDLFQMIQVHFKEDNFYEAGTSAGNLLELYILGNINK